MERLSSASSLGVSGTTAIPTSVDNDVGIGRGANVPGASCRTREAFAAGTSRATGSSRLRYLSAQFGKSSVSHDFVITLYG